jgi:hypothetical protein
MKADAAEVGKGVEHMRGSSVFHSPATQTPNTNKQHLPLGPVDQSNTHPLTARHHRLRRKDRKAKYPDQNKSPKTRTKVCPESPDQNKSPNHFLLLTRKTGWE